MANSVDPDQTAPIGAVCSGSTLFASILNLSEMLGNYLQQTTSAGYIFRCIFFFQLSIDIRVVMCGTRQKTFLQNIGQVKLLLSADNLCKQFGSRSGQTKRRS